MEPTNNKEILQNGFMNILVNACNQANLIGINSSVMTQMNTILIFVHPYAIEKLNLENVNVEMKVDEDGLVWINNKSFETIEIEPGIKILGILKK